MIALALNFKSSGEWLQKVQKFAEDLRKRFGGRLHLVIALPDPNHCLYDSNVLVVLDSVGLEDLEEVASLAPEDVSPLVVPAEDRHVVEAFRFYEPVESDEWLQKVQKFAEDLRKRFGGRLHLVIALPDPNHCLYDSNVLVVLDSVGLEDLEEVASLAPEDVSPLVVPAEDRHVVEAFRFAGGKAITQG